MLLIFIVALYTISCLTSGSAIPSGAVVSPDLALISTVSHPDLVRSPPSGIVVPLLLCGACVGRLLGLGMLAGLTVQPNPV